MDGLSPPPPPPPPDALLQEESIAAKQARITKKYTFRFNFTIFLLLTLFSFLLSHGNIDFSIKKVGQKNGHKISYADFVFNQKNNDEPDLAQQFGVMSIPFVASFKGGQLHKSSVGVQPKEALLSLLD